jgi:hypothetical protein
MNATHLVNPPAKKKPMGIREVEEFYGIVQSDMIDMDTITVIQKVFHTQMPADAVVQYVEKTYDVVDFQVFQAVIPDDAPDRRLYILHPRHFVHFLLRRNIMGS